MENNKKCIKLILICAVLMLLLSACSSGSNYPVVVVGDEQFCIDIIEGVMKDFLIRYGLTVDELREDPPVYQKLKMDLAMDLAIEVLAEKYAAQVGVVLSESEMESIDLRIQWLITNAEGTYAYFDARNTTSEAYRERLIRLALLDRLKEDLVADITYEDLMAFYLENSERQSKMSAQEIMLQRVRLFYPDGFVFVKHILLAFDPSITLTAIELYSDGEFARLDALYSQQARLLENEITNIREAIARGESFTDLIYLYNDDTAMNHEPQRSRGFFIAPNHELFSNYREAVDKLENPGDIQETMTHRGYYFIKAVDIIYEGVVPFDIVEAEIRNAILDNRLSQDWQELIQSWVDEAERQGTLVFNFG